MLTCPGLTAEDAPQASDLITVGGAWYSVADSYDAAGAPTATTSHRAKRASATTRSHRASSVGQTHKKPYRGRFVPMTLRI